MAPESAAASAAESAETAAATVPDVRRDQMLRAAAELIGERGFSETRIADVARRSGASPALVIYYFGTKDELLTAALRYSEDLFYATIRTQLDELPTARARLELLVRLTCVPQGYDEVPGAWGLWFDLWVQAFRHPEVSKDRIELDQRWRDTVAGVVLAGQAAGEISADADVDTFTQTFAALLDGLSIQVALLDPIVDADRAFTLAMGYATRELGLAAAKRKRAASSRRSPSTRAR
jgi:AcrR family transcriptional regulator